MLRTFLSSVAVLALVVAVAYADDKKDKDQKDQGDRVRATVTKMDTGKNTIALRYKDKQGKEIDRTFDLKDVKYFDAAGKTATVDTFKQGTNIWFVEKDGRLSELRMDKDAGKIDPGKKDK